SSPPDQRQAPAPRSRRALPGLPRRPRPPVDPEARMALIGHLRELRDRLIRVVIGLVLTTTFSFLIIDRLMNFFLRLVPQSDDRIHVIVIEPTEAFVSYFKVALTFGIIFAMPLLVYQIFRFIAPGLTGPERRWLLVGLPVIISFFVAGLCFCYFL